MVSTCPRAAWSTHIKTIFFPLSEASTDDEGDVRLGIEDSIVNALLDEYPEVSPDVKMAPLAEEEIRGAVGFRRDIDTVLTEIRPRNQGLAVDSKLVEPAGSTDRAVSELP